MGFFDEFQDTKGNWIGKDEKQTLMENGIAFTIKAVKVEDTSQFGERYVATVDLPATVGEGAGERLLSFPKGTVESRDRMLDAMEKWLEANPEDFPTVKLSKVGRSIIISAA